MDWYGLGRVVDEPGVLPQRARALDPRLPLRPGELLIDVERLNIDAASFRQLEEVTGGDPARLEAEIRSIVATRGKMHNPVTGSGGMLVGRVKEVAPGHPHRDSLRPGQRIATLVSLSLTPLQLDAITAVDPRTDRVEVKGHAILFPSGIYALLPEDFSDTLALAILDVCGAPALVQRYVQPGATVVVLGAGKSGTLCLAQARQSMAGQGRLIALDVSAGAVEALRDAGLCDASATVDARDGVAVMETVRQLTSGRMADLVINCASVPATEMGCVLSVREGGRVIFFSMATSFTAAALGAEGVGKDVEMIIGNGYVPGHAALALELVRSSPRVRALLEARFGG